MGFFKKGPTKRKPGTKRQAPGGAKTRPAKKQRAEEEISSDEESGNEERHPLANVSDEEEFEDAQAKSFREAKRVLSQLRVRNFSFLLGFRSSFGFKFVKATD